MPKQKSTSEWRAALTPLQYTVTREAGTEHPFSGAFWDTWDAGVYHCVCCDTPLFRADAKFDAGCGWPSFFQPVDPGDVRELEDRSFGRVRTEVRCKSCDAHLGHVFDDGPAPSRLRYCINSASLRFEPDR